MIKQPAGSLLTILFLEFIYRSLIYYQTLDDGRNPENKL